MKSPSVFMQQSFRMEAGVGDVKSHVLAAPPCKKGGEAQMDFVIEVVKLLAALATLATVVGFVSKARRSARKGKGRRH